MEQYRKQLEEISDFIRRHKSDEEPEASDVRLFPYTFIQKTWIKSNQFFYITDFPKPEIVYMSPNVEQVLGFPAESFNLDLLLSLTHPEDQAPMMGFMKAVYEYCYLVKVDLGKTSIQLDYRVGTLKGDYIRLLRQSSPLTLDTQGNILYNLSICTDITPYKKSNRIEYQIFGPNKENFHFDIEQYYREKIDLSQREKEILQLIALGKTSEEIGEKLFISKHTVDTHRRHILHKTGTTNTIELLNFAKEKNILDS